MPSDTRLLFILPDLSYITKLIPGKKEHDFSLSDFRQINGSFLDDNQLIQANLEKLFSKIEAGSYNLVLPDFLFTNTIISLEVESEDEVKNYFNKTLLPSLGISQKDFYVDTTILSNYKGMFKVQLTALEKSVVSPLITAIADKKDIKIESISPLSWTSKAIISLEPSVSIMQLGGNLYLAQHYIGLEQTYFTALEEADNFVETVKTLKGTEPSLQTVYLLSNALIDEKLKDKLKETLPVQQLADLGAENEKMPSYVKQVIEAAAKTFSISEYMLPKFEPDLDYKEVVDSENAEEKVEEVETAAAPKKEEKQDDLDLVNNLVKPVVVGAAAAGEDVMAKTELPKPQEINAEALNDGPKEAKVLSDETKEEEKVELNKKVEDLKEETKEEKVKAKAEEEIKVEVKEEVPETKVESTKEVDLAQFANLAIDPSVAGKKTTEEKDDKKEVKMETPKKELIKNKDEAGGMTKMIFIGFLSFIVTVALGVGIGLAYLKFSGNQGEQLDEPVAEVEVTATPTPEATPEPLPEINPEDFDLLVVNATTKAGYAGTTADDLETAGFVGVDAKNAKGIYEDGNYLLVVEDTKENEALLEEVESATDLIFELKIGMEEEDSSGVYSAVVVLSE